VGSPTVLALAQRLVPTWRLAALLPCGNLNFKLAGASSTRTAVKRALTSLDVTARVAARTGLRNRNLFGITDMGAITGPTITDNYGITR
jgi:hypothetical protein